MPESRRPQGSTQTAASSAHMSGGARVSGRMDPGPYEAIVISHLDPQYMGALKVELLKKTKSGATPERTGQLIEVRYLSPFYGVTAFSNASANDGYEYTQKSYGMWAVPPDVNTRVLVIFAEGDISQGFWIGCVQDRYMNFMIPDGRASTELTTTVPNNVQGKKLPVGEYNKQIDPGAGRDPTQFRKPYNRDYTQSLLVQGLIDDETRGTTSTSARREVPSMVFGWSTPGPLDKRPNAPKGLYGEHEQKANVFVNRLGGSSFVMDDGDDKLLRETHASEGPPRYINKEAGTPGGDPTIPHNEMTRLRTRTGHQILLHNSEDLIYVANGRGTAWIELTSDGKIDIYGRDSISLHSDNDINLVADRDVNIEAGRNFNARASARWTQYEEQDGNGNLSGCVNIESKYNTDILVEKDFKKHILGTSDEHVVGVRKVLVDADTHHETLASHFLKTASDAHTVSGAGIYEKATGGIHRVSGQSIFDTAATNINLQSGGLIAGDSGEIHWNSGLSSAATDATDAETAEDVIPLIRHNLPYIEPGILETSVIESIVKRMPTHEPYVQHENLNPLAYKATETDREIDAQLPETQIAPVADTFRKSGTTTSSGSRYNPGSAGVSPSQTQSGGADPLAPNPSGVSRTTAESFDGPIGEPFAGEVPQAINGFTMGETRAFVGALGQRESGNDYTVINSIGFVGKYQFGAAALETLGYCKPGTYSRGNRALRDPAVWTGKNGATSMEAWRRNEGNCQEIAIIENCNFNLRVLRRRGTIDDNDEKDHIAGLMCGSHLLGAGGMNAWARGEGGADAYGTTGDEYYNLGREAIRRA